MALDIYPNLAGTVSELQDGNLAITDTSTTPVCLVLGTASQGPSNAKVQVIRDQESEVVFGDAGSLVRGMYEVRGGGSVTTYLLRINTLSAILYGVGTDDQLTNPTQIETVLADAAAASLYFVYYQNPTTLGGGATIGRLQIQNALGVLVYDNNPGGTPVNNGEVLVYGQLTGGNDIGTNTAFVSLANVVAGTQVTAEAHGSYSGTTVTFDLLNTPVVSGSVVLHIGAHTELSSAFTIDDTTGALTINSGLADSGAVTVDYQWEMNPQTSLRPGQDGTYPSRMKLYEALNDAYTLLESDQFDIVFPMEAFLDDLNVADGATVVLGSGNPTGTNYPVTGSTGDALGYLFMEEYQGTTYYFWDIDGSGVAAIYPSVGLASSTTHIDGTAFQVSDFFEVNFAYQLAAFCFRMGVQEEEVAGCIGVNNPITNSVKNVAQWIGQLPALDPTNTFIQTNGTGLLGNKFMSGTTTRQPGFYATYSGQLPTGNFSTNTDIITDRGGNKIDIGKYIDVVASPVIYYNAYDKTGLGYQASMATYYGGFQTTLAPASAPTNKVMAGLGTPFRIFKPKLNLLSGQHYVALKEKEGVLRVADAPTAAQATSDFTRRSTVRIVQAAIEIIRTVAEPYIGEANTATARQALNTGLQKELADFQNAGNCTRFSVNALASAAQTITGDATIEFTIVPAFELRKITVVTSLAQQ